MIIINHYLGFAIRIEEKENGTFFKRKKQEEVFCKLRVSADSFTEAQIKLCDTMQSYKMLVAFIFPYVEEDIK